MQDILDFNPDDLDDIEPITDDEIEAENPPDVFDVDKDLTDEEKHDLKNHALGMMEGDRA